MILAQVTKTDNESPLSVIRRFQKRVRDAGFLQNVKNRRFKTRKLSDYKKRMGTLVKIAKRKEYEKLLRLGKIKDVVHKK